MTDEMTVCAAAFFRNKGKTVTTHDEFVMSVSMDYHWFPLNDAKKLLEAMISKGLIEKSGDSLKANFDVGSVDVPVAYKPSKTICASVPKKLENHETQNVLPKLVERAISSGIEKKNFVAESNRVSKTLNVDMVVAGLIVLREHKIQYLDLVEPVYSEIKTK